MKRLNLVPLQCALVSGWTFRLVDAGYRSDMGRGSVTYVGTRFNCEGIIKRFVLCKKYLIFLCWGARSSWSPHHTCCRHHRWVVLWKHLGVKCCRQQWTTHEDDDFPILKERAPFSESKQLCVSLVAAIVVHCFHCCSLLHCCLLLLLFFTDGRWTVPEPDSVYQTTFLKSWPPFRLGANDSKTTDNFTRHVLFAAHKSTFVTIVLLNPGSIVST